MQDPTPESLYPLLDKAHFLLKDGHYHGEGIIIKRDGFVNKFGDVVWAKVVRKDYQAKHARRHGITLQSPKKTKERRIVEQFLRVSTIDKVMIQVKKEGLTKTKERRVIIGRTFVEFIEEEILAIIKKFKSPTINFTVLRRETAKYIDELKPELKNEKTQ